MINLNQVTLNFLNLRINAIGTDDVAPAGYLTWQWVAFPKNLSFTESYLLVEQGKLGNFVVDDSVPHDVSFSQTHKPLQRNRDFPEPQRA